MRDLRVVPSGRLAVFGLSRRVLSGLAALIVVVLVSVFLLAKCAGTAHRDRQDAIRPGASSVATPVSGLPTVRLTDLPTEAQDMLALIDKGGPFRYAQDGVVFSNFEGLLPAQPRGYYREYTVTTPGASNRGTRRLVVGLGGDVYYTSDHYESFRQVLR